MVISWTIVIDWFSKYGWSILFIIAIYLVLYFMMRRFVPVAVKRAVTHTMKDKPDTLIKKEQIR